jgi:aminoglycoside/choline kinase family phosphotransferase
MARQTEVVDDVELSAIDVLLGLARRCDAGVEPQVERLKGDGSDRRLYRLRFPGHGSVIGVVHADRKENDDFLYVTEAFRCAGLAAPEVLAVAADRMAYLLEDLGLATLADRIEVWRSAGEREKIVGAYRRVLCCLVKMQSVLSASMASFLANRVMDRRLFKTDIDDFRRDFVLRFDLSDRFDWRTERELTDRLIDRLVAVPADCFVYRDLQSRNIMWRDGAPVFIDYQSALLGPCYYDLASLLFSSRSGLDMAQREGLLRYYYDLAAPALSFQPFREHFYRFVLLRRLRSLGTYGRLSMDKGKQQFFQGIQPTLAEVGELLVSGAITPPLPLLAAAVAATAEIWAHRSGSVWG